VFVIVGLGNPGHEYEDTRHNVGFRVIDMLAERAGARLSDKKFKARVGRARLCGEDCLLMKPETFMNLSGEAVGPAMGFFKVPTTQVIVVHDELDVPLGRLKMKKGGGHGGHNGLRSLKKHLPDDGFVRLRVGIGRPPPQWESADYVLSKFNRDERASIDSVLDEAADAVQAILTDGVAKAMGRFNRDPDKERAKAEKRQNKIDSGLIESATKNESRTEGES
jgi:PTH1 family peptidyl-tRNA hydrolase